MTSTTGQAAVPEPHTGAVEPQDDLQDTSLSMAAGGGGLGAGAKSLRKRTKTGCLTCRRRRIKCGEERPICSNCVKSKRNCDGYNQRVVFKDPLSGFRPGPLGGPTHLVDQSLSFSPNPITGAAQLGQYEPAAVAGLGAFPTIAPRPPPTRYAYDPTDNNPPQPAPQIQTAGRYDDRTQIPPITPTRQQFTEAGLPPRLRQIFDEPVPSPVQQKPPPGFGQDGPQRFPDMSTYTGWQSGPEKQQAITREEGLPSSYGHLENAYLPPSSSFVVSKDSFIPLTAGQVPTLPTTAPGRPIHHVHDHLARYGPITFPAPVGSHPAAAGGEGFQGIDDRWHGASIHNVEPSHRNQVPMERPQQVVTYGPAANAPLSGGLRMLPQPEASESDDDMDLEPASGTTTSGAGPSTGDREGLNIIMSLRSGYDERPIRTFTDVLNRPNILATYRPSPLASPLLDPQAARIFCHFITATGPSFSIYERHPANPSVLFTGAPVPLSHQSLWTYTLPTMALSSPPLMHAMLALASLHISKLQGGTTIPSLKHYHMALRRVAKYVSIPNKRAEIATLAATLLLGFWEVMAAEHAKWNSHLLGARQLLVEFDFLGMTKQIKALKAQRAADRRAQMPYGVDERILRFPTKARKFGEEVYLGVEQDVDEDLVGLFTGRKLRYDEFGRIVDDPAKAHGFDGPRRELTTKDIEDYEIRRDLFWWFAKQDMYQSILSGNGLLSDYSRWSDCPPRAAIGRREAPYGSTDHLILLMGRIADFSARDQRRKRKLMETSGGRWRPPPDMDLGPPSQAPPPPPPSDLRHLDGGQQAQSRNPDSNSASANAVPQMPVMYGMIPSPGPSKMPTAFKSDGHPSPESSSSDDLELEAAAVEAEDEWNEIKRALQVFEECLGPSFHPLTSEYMPPTPTPFGSALYYKTYSMSCMWAVYNLGHIVLQRAHPSMPPLAMMAAGVAAKKTARFANEIGRIAAGLFPTDLNTPINPTLGAALTECSMALFFAGVQYQDAAQRAWTVNSLQEIGRRTGWDSITTIASGCETAWEKAAQMGRGPPYLRRTTKPRYIERAPHQMGDGRIDTTDPGTTASGMRLHYAMGLLEDFATLGV